MMPNQHLKEKLAESARYALLRRLAPLLRHNMAGSLQPLSMMATLLEKRLQNSSPDLAALARSSSQLNTAALDAASECMGLMTWLAPATSDSVSAAAAIDDAVGLVATELSFKGFTVINRLGDVQAKLPRSLTRNVFMAALLAMTDAATAPANAVLQARLEGGELVLTISIQAGQGEPLPISQPCYRHLQWEEVEVLADVESVRVVRSADSCNLHFPLAAAVVIRPGPAASTLHR